MQQKQHLKTGDRVEHATAGGMIYGTVRRISDSFVLVEWDNGQTGLLYWGDEGLARAKDLIKIRPQKI